MILLNLFLSITLREYEDRFENIERREHLQIKL